MEFINWNLICYLWVWITFCFCWNIQCVNIENEISWKHKLNIMEYLARWIRKTYFFFGSYMNDAIVHAMNELCRLLHRWRHTKNTSKIQFQEMAYISSYCGIDIHTARFVININVNAFFMARQNEAMETVQWKRSYVSRQKRFSGEIHNRPNGDNRRQQTLEDGQGEITVAPESHCDTFLLSKKFFCRAW